MERKEQRHKEKRDKVAKHEGKETCKETKKEEEQGRRKGLKNEEYRHGMEVMNKK